MQYLWAWHDNVEDSKQYMCRNKLSYYLHLLFQVLIVSGHKTWQIMLSSFMKRTQISKILMKCHQLSVRSNLLLFLVSLYFMSISIHCLEYNISVSLIWNPQLLDYYSVCISILLHIIVFAYQFCYKNMFLLQNHIISYISACFLS